jgi:hypothetical protein
MNIPIADSTLVHDLALDDGEKRRWQKHDALREIIKAVD